MNAKSTFLSGGSQLNPDTRDVLPWGSSYFYAPDGETVVAIVRWEVGDNDTLIPRDRFWLPAGVSRPDNLSLRTSTIKEVSLTFQRLCEEGQLFRCGDVFGGPGQFCRISDMRTGRGQTYMVQCGKRVGLNFPPDTAMIFVDDSDQLGTAGKLLSYDELIALINHPDTKWLQADGQDPDMTSSFREGSDGQVVGADLSLLQYHHDEAQRAARWATRLAARAA